MSHDVHGEWLCRSIRISESIFTVHQPWRDLRDSLAAALSETRTNLLGVADVLAMAVTTYRETDDDAAAAFRDAMKTRPEPQPTLRDPVPR